MISKAEEDEARRTRCLKTTGGPGNVKIKVMIPVKIGGYTGQRDQWQEFEHDFVVEGDYNEVTLTETQSIPGTKITLSVNDLQAALRAVGVQQGPVMR